MVFLLRTPAQCRCQCWDFSNPIVLEACIDAQKTTDGEYEDDPITQYLIFSGLYEMTAMPLAWMRHEILDHAQEQLQKVLTGNYDLNDVKPTPAQITFYNGILMHEGKNLFDWYERVVSHESFLPLTYLSERMRLPEDQHLAQETTSTSFENW